MCKRCWIAINRSRLTGVDWICTCWRWRVCKKEIVFRVQRHSHFPKSKGIPHSASTIMGRGVSFANAYKNSSLAYRIGLVGIFSSFGGHGSGFEYRTRTRRSSFELEAMINCNEFVLYAWTTHLFLEDMGNYNWICKSQVCRLHKCHVDTVKPCSVALDANHIHCVNTTLT